MTRYKTKRSDTRESLSAACVRDRGGNEGEIVEEEIMGKSAKGETAEEGTMNGGAEVCSVCVTLRKEGATTTNATASQRGERNTRAS